MLNRVFLGGMAAAAAGATMLAIASTPASAFTLNAPSLQGPIAGAGIDHVWYDRWGRWHPGPRPGWGRRYCWRGMYGRLHCSWR